MSQQIVREVARRTGVSQRTVLRILAGDGPTLRPSTLVRAERIRSLAAKLGYQPNAAARAVTTGRFGSIGAITTVGPRGQATIPPLASAGLLEVLAGHGRDLVLSAVPLGDPAAQVLPRMLRERSVDGVIVSHQGRPDPRLDAAIARAGVPGMWLNLRRERDCVHPDDLGVGAAATRMLLGMGHRRIAYGDTPLALAEDDPTNHYSRIDRRRGYEAAMRAAGLEPRLLICPLGDGQGVPRLRQMLAEDRPTAIIAYGSQFIHDADWACRALGVRVPEDISLVSLSGDEHQPGHWTAWMVPEREMGRQCAIRLLAKIEAPDEAQDALGLPFAFNPGMSLAPPPG